MLITATLFAAVLGGAVLAGCAGHGGTTLEDVEEGGFTCAVTFDTAGGNWASGATGGSSTGEDGETTTSRMEERRMYLKPGSKIDRAKAEDFAKAVREGYTFNTFCTASTDGAGNVTYEPWDYSKPVNESLTLYARWMENYSIVAHYGENFSKEKTFNVPQNSDGVAQAITSMDFSTENVTVLATYENADKTGEITISRVTPYTPPCTAENRVHHVYVDTLEGRWTLVRDKADFKISTGSQLYLLADIDLGGDPLDVPSMFWGKINGNNHTVENFKVVERAVDRNDRYFGLFKDVQDDYDAEGNPVGAEIKDITFKDVTFTAELWNPQVIEYSAGVLA
ncbi:MAG: hypothetical protein K2N74_05880, partial [Clostridiales bacterium]|nr:hypothetical protein [Clostridiales bacterium]